MSKEKDKIFKENQQAVYDSLSDAIVEWDKEHLLAVAREDLAHEKFNKEDYSNAQ